MTSIRAKLMLALLATSFVGIAVVGITARVLTLRRFDTLVVNRAFEGFASEITEYFEDYGSWEAAREAESFSAFLNRARPFRPNQGPAGAGRPGSRGPGGRLAARRIFGSQPPPFAVVDDAGRALLPLAGMQVGEVVDPARMRDARPLTIGSDTIGLAVPLRVPERSALEAQYLAAMRDSWLISLVLASLVAIPLGILLGDRIGTPIHALTSAIGRMRAGSLRQTVEVRGGDEIGLMSSAFNDMSQNLANAYDELEASRARLSEQATKLTELSRRDELTQLFNRRAFDEKVEALFAQASRFGHPLTLAMADVDHFKRVNDDFSHAVGDEVLRRVSRLIEENVRKIDVVARYGGEEFAIAFAETPGAGAARLAQRLRELVEEYDWAALAPGLAVTLSVGVAERNGEGSFQEVLDAADTRLYEAKSAGRNRVCFDEGIV